MGIDYPLVPGLASRVQGQTQFVRVGLTLEPVEQELVVTVIDYVPAIPEYKTCYYICMEGFDDGDNFMTHE